MKFLVFIVFLVAGWYVLRWLQQFDVARQQSRKRAADGRSSRKAQSVKRATDTIVCKRCGSYVPSDFPTACERAGCPFPGVG